jgi:hypothetical protein
VTELIDHLSATLLAPDDGRPWRLALLALAALFLWRFCYVLLQEPPPAAPARLPVSITALNASPAPLASPRRSFFPSRKERLEAAIELVNVQTDQLIADTNHIRASAGLVQARAQLAALVRELEPPPALPVPRQERRRPALTQQEIEELLDLVPLAADDRRQLSALVAGRLEEGR